jgi:hypothetical protein
MHELLHVLGLCSDSFSHFDLLDFLMFDNTMLRSLLTNIKQVGLLIISKVL